MYCHSWSCAVYQVVNDFVTSFCFTTSIFLSNSYKFFSVTLSNIVLNLFNYYFPLFLSFSTLFIISFILLQHLLSVRLLFLSKFLIAHTFLPNVYLLPLFLPFLSDFSLSFFFVRLLCICFCKPWISSTVFPFLHLLLFFRCSILLTFSIFHILSCVILYYSLFCLLLHLVLLSIFVVNVDSFAFPLSADYSSV